MKKTFYFTVVAVVVMTTARAQAATYTWTENDSGSHDWSDAANWSSNGVFSSGSGNELKFDFGTKPSTATTTITNVPAALSMNTLTLDGQGPNNSAGADFVIGDNSSTWTIGDASTSAVSLETTRGGGSNDRTIRWNVEPNIVLNRALTTFAGVGTFFRRTFMFKGNITEAGAGYSVTKSGDTWLGFYGTNTYSGATTVSGGVLHLGSDLALPGGMGVMGGSSALTVNNGVLGLGADGLCRALGAGSDQFQVTGGSSGFSAMDAHGYLRVADSLAQEIVWGDVSFNPTALILNKTDSSDNNFTIVNGIDLGSSTRTITVGNLTAFLPGDIRGTGGITKNGDGRLRLSGANTYGGTTTLNAGSLRVSAANNLGDPSGGFTFDGGRLEVLGTTLTNVSDLSNTVTFNNNKNVSLDIVDSANTFTVDQDMNQGSGGLLKYGAGTLVLSSSSTFTGGTEVYGDGSLVLEYSSEDSSKLSDSSALTLSGSTLELSGGTHSETVGSATVPDYAASVITRASGSATINLNALSVGGRTVLTLSEPGIATTDTANNSYGFLSGVIVGSHWGINSTGGNDAPITAYSGYTPFVSSGADANANYELMGSSNLTGNLTVNTLRIESTGDDQVLDLGSNDLIPRRLSQGGGGILYAGGGNDNYTITSSGGRIDPTDHGSMEWLIHTHTGTLNLEAAMYANDSWFIKTGAGTLVLKAASSYNTRETQVEQGVLRLAHGAGTGTAPINVAGGAALELSNNISVSVGLTISGSGPAGGGALRNVAGDNVYSGNITVGGTSARINADSGSSLLITGDVTDKSSDIAFGGDGNITVSNATGRALGITKDGAGTLGIVVDDPNSTQWVCGEMALNDSTLALTFNDAPSETKPVIKVVGDLNFSGTPTIEIVIDEADITAGVRYPLIEVVGSAPATKPTLVASAGALKWGGSGNSTLYLDTSPQGTVLLVR